MKKSIFGIAAAVIGAALFGGGVYTCVQETKKNRIGCIEIDEVEDDELIEEAEAEI